MPATDEFVYLESMRELADWRPETCSEHAVNISNTPLCPRPIATVREPNKIETLVVCHDFKGGYPPFEAAQGLPSLETAYSAEYLSYISSFIYFTHKRVTIPPAPWINALHRNGVQVLGTLLVEHSEGASEAGKLFQKGSEGEFLYATQLARIAQTYGFDGWLINIESTFPPSPLGKWSPMECQKFLRELKQAGCVVVWYDAVTILNQVHYQNGLTLLNAPFFKESDQLFTNYWWTPGMQMWSTNKMAAIFGREEDVLMGIDCYGRGSFGDGGFGVGVALKEIQSNGLSAGLFAPGWTFENFDGKDFHQIDKRFWTGEPSSAGSVADFVGNKEAGTQRFFYTNFNRGFGSGFWLRGKKISTNVWTHLGAQSILPNVHSRSLSALQWTLDAGNAYTGAWSLKLTSPASRVHEHLYLPLYKLGITHTADLVLHYALRTDAGTSGWGLYWDFVSSDGTKIRRTEPIDDIYGAWKTGSVLTGDEDVESHVLVELGVYRVSPSPSGSALWLGELALTTLDTESDNQPAFISSVVPRPSGTGRTKLTWSVYSTFGSEIIQEKRKRKECWSEQTKDFAYFVVWNGERMVGVAYACEYVIDGTIESGDRWRVSGVTWEGAVWEGPDGAGDPKST